MSSHHDPSLRSPASPPGPNGTPRTFRPSPGGGTEAAWLPTRSSGGFLRLEDEIGLHLTLLANSKRTIVHRIKPQGTLRATLDEIAAALRALDYRVLIWSETSGKVSFIHDRGFVHVDPSGHSSAPVVVTTIDEEHADTLRAHLGKWVSLDDGPGRLHMLQVYEGDLAFAPIGAGGQPLRRENYSAAVLADVDHAAVDIDALDPCGRFVLLAGPAGTGKTHVVRGLLAAAKRARFVVLQPSEVRSVLDATPLSALGAFVRGDRKRRPVVFVVEDADECLLPRGTDNVSRIAALLNLTDGLVGSAYDIRVIATTNAKSIEIDPALVRPGRLCRRIEVPLLEPDEATRALASLLGRPAETPFARPVTLAEVYQRFREHRAGE